MQSIISRIYLRLLTKNLIFTENIIECNRFIIDCLVNIALVFFERNGSNLKRQIRSNPPQVFLGKRVLKICSKFTGEHPCRSVTSRKLICNFSEIAFRHGCSPVYLQLLFRKPFYGWLLLIDLGLKAKVTIEGFLNLYIHLKSQKNIRRGINSPEGFLKEYFS